MNNNFWYIGLDGGATKCRASVYDIENNYICSNIGESSNIYSVGYNKAKDNIKHLINYCIDQNKLDYNKCVSCCLGSAGLSTEEDRKKINIFLKNLLPKSKIYICSDAEILLVGGLQKSEGMALISGTGSMAIGRMDNKFYRTGGFGWRLGDEGSAWWISHQAILRTLKSKEHRDLPTKLDEKLLINFGFNSMSDFIRFCNTEACTKAIEATFAKKVEESYLEKDLLAIDIHNSAIKELVSLIEALVKTNKQFNLSDLVIAGGIFEKNEIFFNDFTSLLKVKLPNIKVFKPKGTALEGAILIAKGLII